MFYIPKDWLKDRNNEQVVRDILEKHLGNSDLIAEGFENDVEYEKQIAESIINDLKRHNLLGNTQNVTVVYNAEA